MEVTYNRSINRLFLNKLCRGGLIFTQFIKEKLFDWRLYTHDLEMKVRKISL